MSDFADFADLADAGRRLGPVLRAAVADLPDPILLAVLPNGVPVALGIRASVDLPVRGLHADRSDEGVIVHAEAGFAGRCVIVVDDGVETGTVARAAVAALREAGAAIVVLAVPVCPNEAMADLQNRYDRIVAVVRPMAPRSLASHYALFDTVDDASALRLLAEGGAPPTS